MIFNGCYVFSPPFLSISFVKSSKKYYDDAATILCDLMSQAMGRNTHYNEDEDNSDQDDDDPDHHQLDVLPSSTTRTREQYSKSEELHPAINKLPSDYNSGSKSFDGTSTNVDGTVVEGDCRELRCVVAVVRHGDRTPKEKMKMNVTDPMWMEFFSLYGK